MDCPSRSWLLEEESPHETFLSRLGMNPFAAQMLLSEFSLRELLVAPSLAALRDKFSASLPVELLEHFFLLIASRRSPPQRPRVRQLTPRSPMRKVGADISVDERLDEIERLGALTPRPPSRLQYELPRGSAAGQTQLKWVPVAEEVRPQSTTPLKQLTPRSIAKPARRAVPGAVTPSIIARTPPREGLLDHLVDFFGHVRTSRDEDYGEPSPPCCPAKKKSKPTKSPAAKTKAASRQTLYS
jgi:hypothetical protein